KKLGGVALSSDIEQPTPVRWIAESEDVVVGAVERTSRGKYRAPNVHGRTVGTYRTLSEARVELAHKCGASTRQRTDQSKFLVIGGLVALIATAAIAVVGVVLMLTL